MEFLGIGYQEILLVFVLMLVFVGPERMPRVAYQIGRAVREMQKYARAVRDEFSEEIEYLETQYREVEAEMKQAQASLKAESARFDQEMRDATSSIDRAVKDAAREIEAPVRAPGASNVVPLSAARATDGASPSPNGGTPAVGSAPVENGEPSTPAVPGSTSSDPGTRLVF